MQGFKTDYVNLIADNLRDRYDNGFSILKELIQNADDANARTLIFGRHPGSRESPHPLLQGSGLWFFKTTAGSSRVVPRIFDPSDSTARLVTLVPSASSAWA